MKRMKLPGIKKFLPRSLFGRSLLILVIPILLIQIITTFIFFDRHWSRMTDRLAFAVAGEIAVISSQIEKDTALENIKEITKYAGQNLQLLISYESGAQLNAKEKDSHQSLKNTIILDPLSRAMDEQVRRSYRINADEREKWIEVSLQLKQGLLRVSLPQRRLFSSSSYIFLLWMFSISLVLLIVAILFMRNQIRPIRRLAVAAERFGKGMEVSSSFKPEGAREVRQASRAFLDMQANIKRQIQQRTAMLSGVSHDLRTPLTRMKLQVAMLDNTPDVEALKTDIADMERMIDAYLDFVRGEGGEPPVRMDLRLVIERIVSGVKRQGGHVELKMDESDIFLHLRPVSFERALSNIINNAHKYGGNIWISAKLLDNGLEITVDDNGSGIPVDKRDDVFRPFYRVDESRNAATGGVGLGLPIAQDIIHSHGGKISLSESAYGGLRVVIYLPV